MTEPFLKAPLEAFIFDVDGTLADTERDGHRSAFNRAFREAGLDWHWDVARYGELLAVTGGRERMRHHLSLEHPAMLEDPGIEALIADLHRAKTRHYTEFVASGAVPLRPGVARVISQARAEGLRLAIATTTTLENVTALLEHSLGRGASGWFECIGAGDAVPAKKPAPDIYLWVLEEMRLRPAHCLAFEDSENGLRAARGAGIATIVTINEYTARQDFAGAEVVLSDLGEQTRPYTCLAGDALGGGYVDLAKLRSWHAMNTAIGRSARSLDEN